MALRADVNADDDIDGDVEGNQNWIRSRSPVPRVTSPAISTPPRLSVLDGAEDYKSALTARYLEEQRATSEDGDVPPSEHVFNEHGERVTNVAGSTNAFGREEAEDYGSGLRLRGFARAGECLELKGYDDKREGTTRWQRVTPHGGVELIEHARGTRYVCQDADIGCAVRAVRGGNGEVVAAMTEDAVEAAVDRQKEEIEGKRKEFVLEEVPLGPSSAAYKLHVRGKMLEAEACEADPADELSDGKAKEALKCYVIAAKERFVPAYSSIGRMYELGIGMDCDYEQARGWYKEGVKEGCPICANNLGVLEYLELGIDANKESAASYFQTAVAHGNPAAMNNLALCHEEGIGVPQNFYEARDYYEMAARGGIMSAFVSLGYSQIINGELDEALDAFKAGLNCGIEDAADGTVLLSNLNAPKHEVICDRAEVLAKELSIESLTKEVEKYAELSRRLHEIIMMTGSERVKSRANRCIDEIFHS